MQKRMLREIAFLFFFVLFCFFFANVWVADAQDTPAAQLSEAKKQKWEGIQKILRNDLAVCREHCGHDKTCEDKCESAFKYRIEVEYKKLLSEGQ